MNRCFVLICFMVALLVVLPAISSAQEPLTGALVTSASQIEEVALFSNTVALSPRTYDEYYNYLRYIGGRMNIVFGVIGLYAPEGYLVRDELLSYALSFHVSEGDHLDGYTNRIIFHFDEPLWQLRENCKNGNLKACEQSDNNGQQALEILRGIVEDIRNFANRPGFETDYVEISIVESWTEAAIQWEKTGQFHMLWEADHLGFNCYGDPYNCGGGESYGSIDIFTYNAQLWDSIISNGSNARIVLVPAIAVGEGVPNEDRMLEWLAMYERQFQIYKGTIVSGMIGFLWGSFEGWIGARDLSVNTRESVKATFESVQ